MRGFKASVSEQIYQSFTLIFVSHDTYPAFPPHFYLVWSIPKYHHQLSNHRIVSLSFWFDRYMAQRVKHFMDFNVSLIMKTPGNQFVCFGQYKFMVGYSQ